MREAARGFLDALDETQRARAFLPFETDGERTRWFYVPTDHGGLPLAEMTPRQEEAAHKLLAASLSVGGHATVSLVMALENILAAEFGFQASPRFPAHWRAHDPRLYFFTVFGTPDAPIWGWRVGGHHISLHFTISGGEVRYLPSFIGAEPRDVGGIGQNVVRPLAAETDMGREFMHSLTSEQRRQALLAPIAPMDIVSGNRARLEPGARPRALTELFREPASGPGVDEAQARRDAYPADQLEAVEYTEEPKGVPVSALDASQREAFYALVRQYIDRIPDDLAEAEFRRLRGLDPAGVRFAWAGGIEPEDRSYYRIQGDDLLIEHDMNSRGNHIHAVWRGAHSDFGRDLLAEHYAAEPH
jgi:hypothetical protein